MAQIYSQRDPSLRFNLGAPGPWEQKEVPTIEDVAGDIDSFLESAKDHILSAGGEPPAAEGGGGPLSPGEEGRVLQPVDEERERRWRGVKEATLFNVLSHEVAEYQQRVRRGESLLGVKQEESALARIRESAGAKGVCAAALSKYQAVLEANPQWSFADKANVMKGLAQALSHSG